MTISLKEKLDNKDDSFLTGLTVNVAKDVTRKTKVKPSLYAVKYIKDYMEGAAQTKKPSVDKVGHLQRITCYVVKKLPKVDADILFRVRVTTLANDKTGTLYILIFGTPEDDWKETYKVGQKLYNPIVLDGDI